MHPSAAALDRTRQANRACRRQCGEGRADLRCALRRQFIHAVLKLRDDRIVFRRAVYSEVREHIPSRRSNGKLYRLAASRRHCQLIRGDRSARNVRGQLYGIHVLRAQSVKSFVLPRALVIGHFPVGKFDFRIERIEAGDGFSAQPVEVDAEFIHAVENVVIARVVFDDTNVYRVAPRSRFIIAVLLVASVAVEVEQEIAEFLPAAVRKIVAVEAHDVEIGRALHIEYARRGERTDNLPIVFDIDGITVTGRFDSLEENRLIAVEGRFNRLFFAAFAALHVRQIPTIGFCKSVIAVAELRTLDVYVDISVAVERISIPHFISAKLRQRGFQEGVLLRAHSHNVAVCGNKANLVGHARILVHLIIERFPRSKEFCC